MKFRGILFIVFAGVCFWSSYSIAQPSGQELFEQMNCFKCHDPEYNKLGPPLKVIAKAFEKREKLLVYFNGQMAPIVKPEMAEIMSEYLKKISALGDQEKASLASYIMNHK